MACLRQVFESLGCLNVKTLLNSGNVVFSLPERATIDGLSQPLEISLQQEFAFNIPVILRSFDELQALRDSRPFRDAPAGAKLNVTFLGGPPVITTVPSAKGITITRSTDREVTSAVADSVTTLTLMELLETAYGKNLTTRRWETVLKALAA
jgi:uncharacterized protein (DUF1697 family)